VKQIIHNPKCPVSINRNIVPFWIFAISSPVAKQHIARIFFSFLFQGDPNKWVCLAISGCENGNLVTKHQLRGCSYMMFMLVENRTWGVGGWGLGRWGGLLTFMFTCTPSWCYVAEIFSCTCIQQGGWVGCGGVLFLHLLRYKILYCTLTHTWCYVSKTFSCTC